MCTPYKVKFCVPDLCSFFFFSFFSPPNLVLHRQHVSKKTKTKTTLLSSNNLKKPIMNPDTVVKPQALCFIYYYTGILITI